MSGRHVGVAVVDRRGVVDGCCARGIPRVSAALRPVCSRARDELHRPRYRHNISDTEPVSRDTPPVSPIPGWYSSCSLPLRPGGSRHQPHNILLLFAAQITEGGGLSSTVSSVSRSGTRWERVAPCRRSRCGDRRRRRCTRGIPRAPATPTFCSCASVLQCVWVVAGRWALL